MPQVLKRLAPAPPPPHENRKITFTVTTNHHYPPPASVARRNARERNRVKQVNNGFATLRQHIPSAISAAITGNSRANSKKLSKVDTLRLAVEYIRSLQQLLEEHDDMSEKRSCSELSASPTPSYTSDTSSADNSYNGQTVIYQQEYHHKYEPMSPEDEELLDVISWWQQQ